MSISIPGAGGGPPREPPPDLSAAASVLDGAADLANAVVRRDLAAASTTTGEGVIGAPRVAERQRPAPPIHAVEGVVLLAENSPILKRYTQESLRSSRF